MMNLKKLTNNWRKGILLSACFVFTVSVLPSCKKTSSEFGTEVLDINDLLAAGGKDTFELKTYTVLEDSLPTDNQIYGTLGAYHDPKFGIVNTSLYTQLSLSGTVTLPDGTATVDSVVLSLAYGGYYGKLDPQTFEIHQLSEKLHKDSTYYRHTTKATMGSNLVDPGSATQTPNTTDSVHIDKDGDGDIDALRPQLRLKLDNTLGQQFVDDIIAGNGAFVSGDEFLNSGYFKGFKINVANASPGIGKGAVLYFNLGSSDTKMTIYFKHSENPTTQRRVELVVNSSCGDFNHVEVNHLSYHIADVLANPLNGQTQFYTQSFDSRAVIEFPSVKDLKSNSVINNALLYIPVSYHNKDVYYPSITLELGYKTDSGKIVTFRTASYDNNQKAFILDLRDYIQDIVSGKAENRGLYLYQSSLYFNCTAERIVFNGPASPFKAKPKLVIKYTEFK
ncbi:MAG: hypothetical protein K0S23_1922 [Fluviicola sp.]|jgi:hypothetical protein|uniref:DUF4270 family protein n=1 Tax=Fluviicola sp. TaxID=1917219 RepID=UPI002603FDA4|nr:DUF4270 family protein [Fluviicola sp.]MDF3027615.1 hypothetical protein [Fluviicola sp.]